MGTIPTAAVCQAWSLPKPLTLGEEGLEFPMAGDVLSCSCISSSKASEQGPTLGRLPAAS